MELETFVENAKLICKNKDVSVSAACMNAGLSVSWLSDIENKGTRPRIDTVMAFAHYLGVTVSELLGETPPVVSDLDTMYNALTPQGQKEVRAFVEFKAAQERGGKE